MIIDIFDTRDRLMLVLSAACKERDQRRRLVDGRPEWVDYERTVMLAEVNVIRAERGFAPVGIEEIAQADDSATGHCDWFEKFSLYCAEIATNE